LTYIIGLVNQELLLQNEYLVAENRILKARLQPGWRLSDGERCTLAEIGRRLGRKGLISVARIAKPDTIFTPVTEPQANFYIPMRWDNSTLRPEQS
jgi:putative transposase